LRGLELLRVLPDAASSPTLGFDGQPNYIGVAKNGNEARRIGLK